MERTTESTPEPLTGEALGEGPALVMEDFVFGGIEANDEVLLATLRRQSNGVRHRNAMTPRDPQPGEAVQIEVFVGPAFALDHLTAYVTTDGSEPSGHRGVATNGFAVALTPVGPQWEAILWDYVERWRGEIAGQPEGALVQYRIEGWRSGDADFAVWSNELHIDGVDELSTRYGYHVDRFVTPPWARAAVLYQLFVDRFAYPAQAPANPTGRWLTPAELNEFTGGGLRPIIDKLDYIVDLGATVIWLTPIFATPSYHGYDTSNYYEIDPRFGTKADLRELVDAAHTRGVRVILDFVANHTSLDFAPFRQAHRDPAAPSRSWFSFGDTYTHGYRTFFNVASMPQFNSDDPGARRYLIDAAVYWLTEFDIDGYRLDYAAGPSLAFWSEFRAACRGTRPDCWLFGEVTLAGEDLRAYEGRLDGCLDFSFCRLLRQLCAGPQPTITLSHFVNSVTKSRRFFSPDFIQPAFLDNHDMNRFLWAAGNQPNRLRLAVSLLFALGDAPILYYGTEIGLSQPRGKGPWREEARHPMRWGATQDRELFAFCQGLIQFRRQHPALHSGALVTLQLDEERLLWLAQRQVGDDGVLIALNLSTLPQSITLPPGNYLDQQGNRLTSPCALPARTCQLYSLQVQP